MDECKELYTQIERLTAFSIEEAICDHCGAGYTDTSDLPMTIPLSKNFWAEIYTPSKIIKCCICVSKNTNGLYDLHVTSITVKKRIRRS